MTQVEAVTWMAYLQKRGSLNVGMRLEIGFAQLMALVVNRTGGLAGKRTAKIEDFLPKRMVENSEPISLAEAMRTWK